MSHLSTKEKKKLHLREVPCKYTKEEVFAPKRKFKSLSFGTYIT